MNVDEAISIALGMADRNAGIAAAWAAAGHDESACREEREVEAIRTLAVEVGRLRLKLDLAVDWTVDEHWDVDTGMYAVPEAAPGDEQVTGREVDSIVREEIGRRAAIIAEPDAEGGR